MNSSSVHVDQEPNESSEHCRTEDSIRISENSLAQLKKCVSSPRRSPRNSCRSSESSENSITKNNPEKIKSRNSNSLSKNLFKSSSTLESEEEKEEIVPVCNNLVMEIVKKRRSKRISESNINRRKDSRSDIQDDMVKNIVSKTKENNGQIEISPFRLRRKSIVKQESVVKCKTETVAKIESNVVKCLEQSKDKISRHKTLSGLESEIFGESYIEKEQCTSDVQDSGEELLSDILSDEDSSDEQFLKQKYLTDYLDKSKLPDHCSSEINLRGEEVVKDIDVNERSIEESSVTIVKDIVSSNVKANTEQMNIENSSPRKKIKSLQHFIISVEKELLVKNKNNARFSDVHTTVGVSQKSMTKKYNNGGLFDVHTDCGESVGSPQYEEKTVVGVEETVTWTSMDTNTLDHRGSLPAPTKNENNTNDKLVSVPAPARNEGNELMSLPATMRGEDSKSEDKHVILPARGRSEDNKTDDKSVFLHLRSKENMLMSLTEPVRGEENGTIDNSVSLMSLPAPARSEENKIDDKPLSLPAPVRSKGKRSHDKPMSLPGRCKSKENKLMSLPATVRSEENNTDDKPVSLPARKRSKDNKCDRRHVSNKSPTVDVKHILKKMDLLKRYPFINAIPATPPQRLTNGTGFKTICNGYGNTELRTSDQAVPESGMVKAVSLETSHDEEMESHDEQNEEGVPENVEEDGRIREESHLEIHRQEEFGGFVKPIDCPPKLAFQEVYIASKEPFINFMKEKECPPKSKHQEINDDSDSPFERFVEPIDCSPKLPSQEDSNASKKPFINFIKSSDSSPKSASQEDNDYPVTPFIDYIKPKDGPPKLSSQGPSNRSQICTLTKTAESKSECLDQMKIKSSASTHLPIFNMHLITRTKPNENSSAYCKTMNKINTNNIGRSHITNIQQINLEKDTDLSKNVTTISDKVSVVRACKSPNKTDHLVNSETNMDLEVNIEQPIVSFYNSAPLVDRKRKCDELNMSEQIKKAKLVDINDSNGKIDQTDSWNEEHSKKYYKLLECSLKNVEKQIQTKVNKAKKASKNSKKAIDKLVQLSITDADQFEKNVRCLAIQVKHIQLDILCQKVIESFNNKNYVDNPEALSSLQTKIFCFVMELSQMCPDIVDVLTNALHDFICLHSETVLLSILKSYVQFYVCLCRWKNKIKSVTSFLYDSIYFHKKRILDITSVVFTKWPSVYPTWNGCYLFEVMTFCILNESYNKLDQRSDIIDMKTLLRRNYRYYKQHTLMSLFEEIMIAFTSKKSCCGSLCLERAIVLLAKSWRSTDDMFNVVCTRNLMPTIKQSLDENNVELTVRCANLLGMIGKALPRGQSQLFIHSILELFKQALLHFNCSTNSQVRIAIGRSIGFLANHNFKSTLMILLSIDWTDSEIDFLISDICSKVLIIRNVDWWNEYLKVNMGNG